MKAEDEMTRPGTAFYTWSCPLCPVVRGMRTDDAREAADQAVRALRVRVHISDDHEHGPVSDIQNPCVPTTSTSACRSPSTGDDHAGVPTSVRDAHATLR